MDGLEFHQEIITIAEPDEAGALCFSEGNARRLQERFREELEKETYPAVVNEFVRAVAAFHSGGEEKAAAQLIELGTQAALEIKDLNASAAEKLKEVVTGAEDMTKMRPVGAQPPPKGSMKASDLIPRPPKQRG